MIDAISRLDYVPIHNRRENQANSRISNHVGAMTLSDKVRFGLKKERQGFISDIGTVAMKPVHFGAKGLSYGFKGIKFAVAQPFVFVYNNLFVKTLGPVKAKAKYEYEEGLKLKIRPNFF